jgi:hypothetical protein
MTKTMTTKRTNNALILTVDLRPQTIKRQAVGTIQDLEYSFKRAAARGDLTRMAIIITTAVLYNAAAGPAAAYAYTPGEIGRKAQPIIDLLKDAATPIAYGCYIWAFIRYILGQRAEAKEMLKAITWGFVGIQILPWLFGIISGVGAAPTVAPTTPLPYAN